MKRVIVLLIFICTGVSSFCQIANDVSIFLNNKRVNISLEGLNQKNIKSVNFDKKNRALFLHTKKPVVLLTLDSIYLKYSKKHEPISNVVYFVNNTLISNKDEMKIDDSFYIYLSEWKLSDTNYVDVKYKDLVVVEITLSETEIKPRIVLRGEADSLLSKNE